ncbi:MAG: thioredoxin-dependent thiol peroxidase [bacterium]
MLTVGNNAPDFKVKDQNNKEISLNEFKGKKVVLYFYPKDLTSGCTKEACEFRDSVTVLEKNNVVVLGVSIDSPESHKKFIAKNELPFTLLSDTEKEIVESYGVWKEKNMCGRKYMGIERTTFVIDENGKILKIYPKVKVNGHVQSVLDDLGL